MITWDILIASIPHRDEMLTLLLAELNRQYQPGLGVIVAVDNCDMQYGDKCQKILDASEADYVSFLDDDDWIAEDFVSAIYEAFEQRPDYVGFQVDYTEDGRKMMPVYHTLKYRGWVDNPEALVPGHRPLQPDQARAGHSRPMGRRVRSGSPLG